MNKRAIYEWDNEEIQGFNRSIIDEFRTHHGIVGGPFTGIPLLLLTTKGRKTGLERVVPLAYLRDGGRYIIVASFAGSPVNPPWYYNLLANPEAGVEVGDDSFTARAEVLQEPERTRCFDAVVQKMPDFRNYQDRTSRVIPVIALTPL